MHASNDDRAGTTTRGRLHHSASTDLGALSRIQEGQSIGRQCCGIPNPQGFFLCVSLRQDVSVCARMNDCTFGRVRAPFLGMTSLPLPSIDTL